MEDQQPHHPAFVRYIPEGYVIELKGEINKNAECTLLNMVEWKADTRPQVIIFGFNDVTYITSAGLSVILRMARKSMKENVFLLGYGLNRLQEKLFKAIGITEHILFYPDEYSVMQRLEGMKF